MRKINFYYKLAIFSIIFLFSIVYPADLTPGQETWQQFVPAWFPLFAIALGIGFGITGIAFMLARVFQLHQLETWARSELFEVVGSAFLVLIIIIALGVIDNIFIAATNKRPIDMSLEFTNSISSRLMDRYIDSVKLGAAIGLLSGPPVQYLDATSNPPGSSNTGSPSINNEESYRALMVAIKSFKLNYYTFYAADVFNGHFNLIQSIALTSLGISLLSHSLLSFVNSIAIPVVIPLGLFLSMFTFSRKMGRTLIAFGVGLYIFVPLSILISQIMYDSAFKPDTSIPAVHRPTGNSNIDGFTNGVFALTILEMLIQLTLATIQIISNSTSALVPGCVTGATGLATICGIAQPACAVAFTFICTLLGGISDVGSSTDLITKLSEYLPLLRIPTLMAILDVPTDSAIVALGDTSLNLVATNLGLQIIGLASSLVFHIIPGQAIVVNWIMPIINMVANQKNYLISLYTMNIYAILNQYLAIKLTNITLAYTPYVMQDAVPVLLIPFIMIFIVITGIRSLSPAIGGEIQILGVSELI